MTSPRTEPAKTPKFVAADGYPQALQTMQGDDYVAALFTHSARLCPFASGYLQSQLNELSGPCRKSHLNHLALSCFIIGQQKQLGKDPRQTLAMLASHHHYHRAAEYIARALINDQYLQHQRERISALSAAEADAEDETDNWSLPFALHDNIHPVPASLMRALLQWPEDDALFIQALTVLNRQPALASLVCRYATAYTPQGKQLALKPSLLLLGPQRSRELVLLAHFESNLSKPLFPLRAPILKRRALIQHVLHRLSQELSVALPCRAELIAYLLVYDAWRSPRWTARSQLRTDPQRQPWQVDSWLNNTKAANHRIALRLCHYWKMPQALSDALLLKHNDPRLNALIALSVASVYVLDTVTDIHPENTENHQLQDVLGVWLDALGESAAPPVLQGYLAAVKGAAIDAHYSSDLTDGMRP